MDIYDKYLKRIIISNFHNHVEVLSQMNIMQTPTTVPSPFFIEEISPFGLSEGYANISITDYKLDHPKVQKGLKKPFLRLKVRRRLHTNHCL